MSFEDMLSGPFGGPSPAERVRETTERLRKQREEQERNATPIPQMRAKTIDGVKYLRAEDVADALLAVKSWSRIAMHIKKWLQK